MSPSRSRLRKEDSDPVRTKFPSLGVPIATADGVCGSDSAMGESLCSSCSSDDAELLCLANFLVLRDAQLCIVRDVSCIEPSESRLKLLQMSLFPVRGDVKGETSLGPSSNTSSVGSSSSLNRLLAMGLERVGIRSSSNPISSVEAKKLLIWMLGNVPVRPV